MCYGVIAAFGQGAARSRHSAVPFLLSTLIVASFVASDASAQYPGALISPNYTSPSAPLVIVPGADSTSAIQLQQLSTGMAVL